MLPPQPGGGGGGQNSPANLSYMQMAMQHRNSASNQSAVNYHIQNMKEEPTSGGSGSSNNNYSGLGAHHDDMVSFFSSHFRF